MQNSSKKIVAEILSKLKPENILDAPCGDGWLSLHMHSCIRIDGIDLYDSPSTTSYRKIFKHDLNFGIPEEADIYDTVLCCEGIEHFGNPLLFFESSKKHLKKGGTLIVTTPNTWYPASKMQFLLRGFFPSFPCLIGRINPGSHMHIMPWSFPHLYLYLKLAGFHDIQLHHQELSKPKHFIEWLWGFPQQIYCWLRSKKSQSPEEKTFWMTAASSRSSMGRHLIVSAKAA